MATIRPAPMPSGDIAVNGSDNLVDRIRDRQRTDRINGIQVGKSPSRILELLAAQSSHHVFDGADVLHYIGSLSTPPNVMRGPFAAAASWAWVRYQWAFANTRGVLVPTADALGLKRHHSTTFSEHMGIGFGLALVESVLKTRYPNAAIEFHDVDFVISGLVSHLRLSGDSKRRPDFIAEVMRPGRNSRLYLVECKGRRGVDDGTAVGQLARALTQVEGLTVNGREVPSFVVATQVNAKGFQVLAADPEGEPPSFERPDRLESSPFFEKEGWRRREKVDVPVDYLRKRLSVVRAARLLLEAGETEHVGRLLEEPVPIRARRERSEFECLGHTYRGEQMQLPVQGERLVAFRGAERDRVVAILDGVPVEPDARSSPVNIDSRGGTQIRADIDRSSESRPDDAGVILGVGVHV